uniref:DNA primase large subunit n=1 Tax=Plectus sambesii TaxID=2011161 RepID=A0A914V610_9BILA
MAFHHEKRRLEELKYTGYGAWLTIQYTLYLKEIGLPLSEAVKFWSEEYAQKTIKSGKKVGLRQHSWSQNQRKYEYSLRHMYGLEGGRKNYSAHCCKSLQNRSDGCVFHSFDRAHLKTLLVGDFRLSSAEFDTCLHLMAQGFLTEACRHVKSVVIKRVLSSQFASQGASIISPTKNVDLGYQSQPVISCTLLERQSSESAVEIGSCFDHPLCR